jgi:hypothetical protein
MFDLSGFMPRNEQLAGPACPKQFDSHKDWSYHHCMNSVHTDSIDWMQIWQRLTFRPTERDVAAEVLHGTS